MIQCHIMKHLLFSCPIGNATYRNLCFIRKGHATKPFVPKYMSLRIITILGGLLLVKKKNKDVSIFRTWNGLHAINISFKRAVKDVSFCFTHFPICWNEPHRSGFVHSELTAEILFISPDTCARYYLDASLGLLAGSFRCIRLILISDYHKTTSLLRLVPFPEKDSILMSGKSHVPRSNAETHLSLFQTCQKNNVSFPSVNITK